MTGIEIGRIHNLTVLRVDEEGVWLQDDNEPIMLSRRGAARGVRPGDRLTVFLFRDSAGSLRATLRLPVIQVGEFGFLEVRSVGPHGAFLDWGVEKDLLVPFNQQPERMQVGRSYLVRAGLDREGRPVGSARVEDHLDAEVTGLAEGDEVLLLIWQFTDLGAKVIVNHRYAGLLYRDEIGGGLKPGDRLVGYVKRLRTDGKIDVTLRKVGAEGVEEAKNAVLMALRKSEDGFLPLHDQSPPEVIRELLGISKKVFKKAVGGLYKEGRVELLDAGIRLKR